MAPDGSADDRRNEENPPNPSLQPAEGCCRRPRERYFSPKQKGGIDIFGDTPSLAPGTGSRWYFLFPNMLAFFLADRYPGHVGLMAAVVDRTEDAKILQLNCLKTDFFHARAYPTYLYYNPHREAKEIHLDTGAQPVDLYDTIRHGAGFVRQPRILSLREA